MKTTDIRTRDVAFRTHDFAYRTPIKFGGAVLDRVTVLTVRFHVETAAAVGTTGVGTMPVGNVWAFPSKKLGYSDTLGAMLALADKVADLYLGYTPFAHPLDTTHDLEPEVLKAAAAVSAERNLAEPLPKLAALVVASAFDAALHDAFGKSCGRNVFRCYGPEYVSHDLSHDLGTDYAGEYLPQYLRETPEPTMPVYHLVGALDPLSPGEVAKPVADGLPESLDDWVRTDGLTHLKIKLNGDDFAWDVARVLAVEAVVAAEQARRGVSDWFYSLDFNEKCPDVAYLVGVLETLKDRNPAAFGRVQYVEQPTARDLRANRHQTMHAAAALKPVVIDESLEDLETLHLAREMGYSGVAFKACKGQTQSVLLAAAAQKLNLFRCVQDLTCPGGSLVHSAGLAAHIPGVAAIEANARQYCPAASDGWESRFPGVFTVRGGRMRTGLLGGPGLGAFA